MAGKTLFPSLSSQGSGFYVVFALLLGVVRFGFRLFLDLGLRCFAMGGQSLGCWKVGSWSFERVLIQKPIGTLNSDPTIEVLVRS